MRLNYISTFFIGSGLLATQLYADMTEQILSEIENGRVIRSEIQSLKSVQVPEPEDLNLYVKNKKSAIALGKALFWDMQLGSDGVTACASCHFNAGADSRAKNQINPGFRLSNQDGTSAHSDEFDAEQGPNYHLKASDFPRHVKADPNLFISDVLRDTDDVIGSQGVHYTLFTGAGEEEIVTDPNGFEVGGANTRRVQDRNSPTVINAVFNHRQFWDGRASNIFNGKNPHGDADENALIYKIMDGKLRGVKVRIDNASLASQATGPVLSNIEMSADGRTWTDVGVEILSTDQSEQIKSKRIAERTRQILALQPLALQEVSSTDSVLGKMVEKDGVGLKVRSYAQMISAAFQPEWWKSNEVITLDDNVSHSQMEMNFSLFFGLAVQLYEATLVSDNTRVDQYLEGDLNALTTQELVGFHLADVEARCLNCHGGSELTFASVGRINEQGLTRNRRGDLIDEGYNNIGVRPTLEDLGVGGVDPFGNALGYARKTHMGLYDNPNIEGIEEEMTADLGNDGAFKIPTLRNVELTAPYFHNGGESTLEDVIDFYFRGGNFRTFDINQSHPIIGYSADREVESPITGLGILTGEMLNSGPGLDDADKASLVAFLKALTDERVLYQKAPFDHPQLFIQAGHIGDNVYVDIDLNGQAKDIVVEIPAVGAEGGEPLPSFEENLAD